MNEEMVSQMLVLSVSPHDEIDRAVIDGLIDGRGIETASYSDNKLAVVFQPFVVSEEGVRERIRQSGIPIQREQTRKRGIIGRFVERLASENRRSLGSGRLDCCDLNRANGPKRSV